MTIIFFLNNLRDYFEHYKLRVIAVYYAKINCNLNTILNTPPCLKQHTVLYDMKLSLEKRSASANCRVEFSRRNQTFGTTHED